MAVTKLSLSFEEELAARTREAARTDGRSVSSLVAELTADGLRRRALQAATRSYEDEEGKITTEEMTAARSGWTSWPAGPHA